MFGDGSPRVLARIAVAFWPEFRHQSVLPSIVIATMTDAALGAPISNRRAPTPFLRHNLHNVVMQGNQSSITN